MKSTSITTWSFDGAPVRVLIDDVGEPWWVASDVCRLLGLEDVTSSLRRLDDDEKTLAKTGPLSAQAQNIVNEPGLYKLILESRKPEAARFKRWVTHEVLPSIRRTGGYGIEALDLRDPKALAPLTLRLAQLVQEQQEQLALAVPKVEAFDDLMTAEGSYTLREAGKLLGLGPNRFAWRLEADGFLFRSGKGGLAAKQEYVERGFFETRTGAYGPDDGKHVFVQARVTPKGLDYFRQKYAAAPGVEP